MKKSDTRMQYLQVTGHVVNGLILADGWAMNGYCASGKYLLCGDYRRDLIMSAEVVALSVLSASHFVVNGT